MFKAHFVSSLIALGLSGCSSNPTAVKTFAGQGYLIVDAGTLTLSEDSIGGSGSIVFNDSLAKIDSQNSYRLSFSLNEGGSLSLVSNSTNQLASGVMVKFTRFGSTLNVVIEASGGSKDLSSKFRSVNAASTVTFQLDVHNNENPAHLLGWGSESTAFTELNVLFNSENDGLESPGRGEGNYWGVVLNNATLTQASIGNPKFTEEE